MSYLYGFTMCLSLWITINTLYIKKIITSTMNLRDNVIFYVIFIPFTMIGLYCIKKFFKEK